MDGCSGGSGGVPKHDGVAVGVEVVEKSAIHVVKLHVCAMCTGMYQVPHTSYINIKKIKKLHVPVI